MRTATLLLWVWLLPGLAAAAGLPLQSVSVRASFSALDVLGEVAPERFRQYDACAAFNLPWQRFGTAGWGAATRLQASAGVLHGGGENALAVALVPVVALGRADGAYLLDLGAGAALFSRSRFGRQDFGGPFQFALTLGLAVPLGPRLGLGYRFLHYSDAGLNGDDTTGADLHLAELGWRF